MKRVFRVNVITEIEVVIDTDHINVGFNNDFSKFMWDVDGAEDHATHLAQMHARELIGSDNYVEGYGDIKELGCSVEYCSQDQEIISCTNKPS